MRVLLAYACTANLLPDLQRTLAVQMNLARGFWEMYCKVIITDERMFHSKTAPAIERVVKCWDNGLLNLARMRNAAVDHAKAIGAEWIVHLDADIVIYNWPRLWPVSGWARPQIFQAPSGEADHKIDLALERWFRMGLCMIHRDLFNDKRFCEQFTGYGHEENDFVENVMRGVPEGETDLRLIHLWHNPRAAKNQNAELYHRRRAETQKQNDPKN